MAFFKFRLPGHSSVADAHAGAPGESVEVIRRRARHRLLGSVVLVFVAVVAFPLLFDSQPRPVAVDTPILIPDRQTTPALTVGAPVPAAQAPAKPLLPAASVPTQASLEPGKEEVVPASAATSSAATASSASSAPADKANPAPLSKAQASGPAKEKPSSLATDDGQKAKALLEGKTAPADQGDRFVLQVGAYTDADKVREVRRKLEQAGLKTFTQILDGKDGKRTTRIRLGPFENRAEADKAAARVRKLDLPAHLIVL